MSRSSDAEMDELVEKIVAEMEHASARELAGSEEVVKILHLTDVGRAKRLLQNVDTAATRDERDVGKRAIVRAMLVSTWLQRLYFVIRAALMGLLGALVTVGFILVFGSLSLVLGVLVGVVSFLVSLLVSRLFDVQIVAASRRIVAFLGSHKRLRDFVLNHM